MWRAQKTLNMYWMYLLEVCSRRILYKTNCRSRNMSSSARCGFVWDKARANVLFRFSIVLFVLRAWFERTGKTAQYLNSQMKVIEVLNMWFMETSMKVRLWQKLRKYICARSAETESRFWKLERELSCVVESQWSVSKTSAGRFEFEESFWEAFFTARRLRAFLLTNALRFEAFLVENYDNYAGHYCTGYLTTGAH